jgi:HPt (histidine-containing phosphotransfer) domain-containing protein
MPDTCFDLPEEPACDLPALRAAMRSREEAIQRLTKVFLKEYPEQLQKLREAVASGNARAAEMAAHRLKGNAALLRAAKAKALASDLENAGRDSRLADAAEILPALERDYS